MLRGRKSRSQYLAALITVIVAAAAEEEGRKTDDGGKITEPCAHPPARRHKGLCHACGCYVG